MKSLSSLFSKSFLLLLFFLLPVTSFATVGFVRQINYQGKLTDSSGATVADGSYNMRFRLYNALSGGSEIWTNTLIQNDRVTVTNGLFSVMLGATSTALTGVDFNQPLYLSIDIGGTTNTASPSFDGEMSPRKTLGTVPHAFNADKIDGLDSTALVRSDAVSTVATSSTQTILTLNQLGAGDILRLQAMSSTLLTVTNTGRLGVGTTSPSTAFSVVGSLFASTTATSTFQGGGINLITAGGNTGCFAVDGVCIGGSGGSGTVNSGTQGQFSFYNSAGTALTATSSIFVTQTGKIGIGTTTPGQKLEIASNTGIGHVATRLDNVVASHSLALGAGSVSPFFEYSDNLVFLSQSYSTVGNGGGTERMRLTSGGNLGIGTTSAMAKLTVVGEVMASYFSATTTSATSTIAGALVIGGNLGIGTTTPLYSLDVASTTRTTNLISQNITLSQSFNSIISAVVGSSTGYTNFTGGIGTGGADSTGNAFSSALRITNTGNLVNIGSIQAGETLLTSAGTFGSSTQFPLPSTSNSQDAVIGDLNGDGFGDFVVTVGGSNDQVFVYINLGNGTFASTTYAVGDNPSDVAIGDLNGDGKPDIAVANSNATTMSILMNNGNGTFANQITYSGGAGSSNLVYIAIGDLNGDGKADIATTNSGNLVSLFFNNGNGTFPVFGLFDSPPRLNTGNSPKDIAIGDLNGDGRGDIVVANTSDNNLGIFLNTGNGIFTTMATAGTGSTPSSVAIGDLSGDSIADLVAINQGGGSVSVLINRGNGTFNTHTTYSVGSTPNEAAIADFNSDGRNDIAAVDMSFSGADVHIFLNRGNGVFPTTGTTYSVLDNSTRIATGDLNNDSKPDIVAVSNAGDKVGFVYNQIRPMFLVNASTGNISIGTSTATSTQASLFAKLTVWASTSPSGTAFNVVSAASSTLFTVNNSGKTGISTTSPWRTFSVSGTVGLEGLSAVSVTESALCLSASNELRVNTGVATCTLSSARFKNSIATSTTGLSEILNMRPVSFKYNNGDDSTHLGFIAEEVNALDPRLVAYEADGVTPRSVRYEEFTAILTTAIQELATTTTAQQRDIDQMRADIVATRASIGFNTGGFGSLQDIIDYLASLGARITNGIAYFKDVITDTIFTKSLKVESGVTTKDRTTGKYYCLYVDNGTVRTEEGECSTSGGAQNQPESSIPPTDTEAPVIELIGGATSTLNVGDSYVDPGATVMDNVDHNLGVHTEGSVDTATAGEYILKYNAEDSAGNKAIELRRTVIVLGVDNI
jgi:hypothetical protein